MEIRQNGQRRCSACGKGLSVRTSGWEILSADRKTRFLVCSDQCSGRVHKNLGRKDTARPRRQESAGEALLRELGIG
jgi:hypothetical protein